MVTHKHTRQLHGKDAVPTFAAVQTEKGEIIFTTGIKTTGKRGLITGEADVDIIFLFIYQ